MEIDRELEHVVDAASLATFIGALRGEPELHDQEGLIAYLEQMEAFLQDAADGYLRRYASLTPTAWRLIGDLLYSAAIYE